MNVGAFLGIFALMFLLELPDKTMIATIIMSTKARPSSIVLGASAGFVVQMGIAVGAGGLLTLLPVHVKDVIVAVLFLAGAALPLALSREYRRRGEGGAKRRAASNRPPGVERSPRPSASSSSAEFGDLTQIQAANFAAKTHQPLEVFLAASLALICVSFLGAYGGAALQRIVPLRRGSASAEASSSPRSASTRLVRR